MNKSSKNQDKVQRDNAPLKNKLTEKQAPNDTDKAGLSKMQRANMATQGAVDRQSVGEIGKKKSPETNEILNQKVKNPNKGN